MTGPVLTHIQKIEHIFCVTDGLLRDLPALERLIIPVILVRNSEYIWVISGWSS